MISPVPNLLMFPLLVGQLIVVVLLFKFWRNSFWWFMLGGCLSSLLAFFLQASRFSLTPDSCYGYYKIIPMVLIDINGAIWALIGMFFTTMGFALLGMFIYRQRNRIMEFDRMAGILRS